MNIIQKLKLWLKIYRPRHNYPHGKHIDDVLDKLIGSRWQNVKKVEYYNHNTYKWVELNYKMFPEYNNCRLHYEDLVITFVCDDRDLNYCYKGTITVSNDSDITMMEWSYKRPSRKWMLRFALIQESFFCKKL